MNRSYSKLRHIQEANILLESRRMLIKEEAYTVIPLTINIPYALDAKTNTWKIQPGKYVSVTAKNGVGTQGTSLENFKNFTGIDFVLQGEYFNFVTSTKDAAGNIVGNFILTEDKKGTIKYLEEHYGKSLAPGDKSLMISMAPAKTGSGQAFYTAGTNFIRYDVNKTPTKP